MNILLLRPPLRIDKNAITKIQFLQPSIGISSIAAFLKKKGFGVKVVDMYEYSWSEVISSLENSHVDVVGISCLSGQHFNCYQIARLAKEIIEPQPVTILGGPHATAFDEQIANHYPQIDFVVRGEGEVTTFELLEAIKNKKDLQTVKGIVYNDDGKVIKTGDREPIESLDVLPFPDYSYFDFEKNNYLNDGHLDIDPSLIGTEKLKYAPIITTRGCPYHCLFCGIYWGHKVRFRSVENVLAEIESLFESYRIKHFSIMDDSFCVSINRVEKFCQSLLDRNLKITWTCVARIKPISERMLRMMKEAGCIGLNFGVESGSDEMLKTMNKNTTLDEIVHAFDLVNRIGIRSYALLMVGNPGESKETIEDTVKFIRRCKPQGVIVSPTVILPNSQLHSIALKQKVIDQDYWIKNPDLPFYTAEHGVDQLRLYRLKILLNHYLVQRDIDNAVKILILLLGVWMLTRLGLEINSIRNFFLKIPLLGVLLKKFTTA